jgi:histidine triad (HIT) family protein
MCIFCQIVKKEIPAKIILENDLAMSFLDIKPVNPGHSLVIPKKHFSTIEEIPEEDLIAVVLMMKKVAQKIKDNLSYKAYNIQLNNDKIAGQEIAHLHFHIIPRLEGDGLKLWPQKKYQENQAKEILTKLTK